MADTILRHADTSILISPRGLSEEETAFFCCVYPSMKYIGVYPHTHPGRGGMIQYDYGHENLQGFLAVLEDRLEILQTMPRSKKDVEKICKNGENKVYHSRVIALSQQCKRGRHK